LLPVCKQNMVGGGNRIIFSPCARVPPGAHTPAVAAKTGDFKRRARSYMYSLPSHILQKVFTARCVNGTFLCMASTDSRKITMTINAIDANAVKVFDSWCAYMGFRGRKAGMLYLTRAMRDDRLLVMDKVTRECLVGAATDTIIDLARREAAHAAKVVLYQEGFISDPGAVLDYVKKPRAKP